MERPACQLPVPYRLRLSRTHFLAYNPKYEVRGYCAKPHAAGRFLPFGSSMQEEGRFLAAKPRSGTRGGRFPSDFDACGGFSQRNPRSPTDRRERAHGFRARTRFRGQKREVSRHRRASGRARRRGRGFGATSERGVGRGAGEGEGAVPGAASGAGSSATSECGGIPTRCRASILMPRSVPISRYMKIV